MTKEEYFKISTEKGLTNHCPCIKMCFRNKISALLLGSLYHPTTEKNIGKQMVELEIANNYDEIDETFYVGEEVQRIGNSESYYAQNLCPEFTLNSNKHKPIEIPDLPLESLSFDQENIPSKRLSNLKFKHYSDCLEYSYFKGNEKLTQTRIINNQSEKNMENKFYNLYIVSENSKTEYKIVLNQEQINNTVEAYLKGENSIMIKGTKVNLFNTHTFIIYSIDKISKELNQAMTEEKIREAIKLSKRKLNLDIYRKFGTNISDTFINGLSWGALKEKIYNTQVKANNDQKIFISHSIKDKELVQKFTEDILQTGLNVNIKNEIFNVSIEDAGITTGEAFKERILAELKNAKAVIQIITENYKNSEACLNEMGAAWVLNKKVIPFIHEPITFNNVGFIHITSQMLRINTKTGIKQFVSDFKDDLFSSKYNDSKLDRKIDDFLNHFKNIKLIHSNDLSSQIKTISYNKIADKNLDEFLDILPNKIMEDLKNTPPFNRSQIAKNYIGIKVKWQLTFGFMTVYDDTNVRISLYYYLSKFVFENITFQINPEEFPIVKLAKDGDKFEIIGEIIKCEIPGGIDVKLHSIKLL